MMLMNKDVYGITKTEEVGCFIPEIQRKFIARIIRASNGNQNKMLLFNLDKNMKRGRKAPSLLQKVLKTQNQSREEFCRDVMVDKI